MSPHYFIDGDNPHFRDLSLDEYLGRTCDIITESRRQLYEKVFQSHLRKDSVIMEYGCGPGFLAKAVAPHVAKIYACDISTGALACAEIINSGENIRYLKADARGLAEVEDESLDAVISFAMVQHLTDESCGIVLDNCRRKLRKSGKAVFHVQLQDEVWKTEADWKADRSLKGKLKLRYGLHCFGRSLGAYKTLFRTHGFTVQESLSLLYLNRDDPSRSDSTYLIVAAR